MTAFAGAVDVLFTDPHLSVAATFTPAGGAAVLIRAIWSKADEVAHLMQTGAVAPTLIADIRVADVAAPVEGDALAIEGTTYTVDGVPRKDRDGLIWTLGLRA